MKRAILIVGCLIGLLSIGYAQEEGNEPLEMEVDEEFNQVYDAYQGPAPTAASEVPNKVNQSSSGSVIQQQSVKVEVPQSMNSSNAVIQPTQNIEASPLGESQADRLRRDRQNMEIETERRIVERLEATRMEEERKRAEKASQLFQKEEAAPPPVVVQPAPMMAPPAEPPPAVVKEDIREMVEEIRAEENLEKKEKKSYLHAIVGLSEYENVRNIRGNYSVGIGFGSEVRERVIAEAAFVYSSYDIERTDFAWPLYYYPTYNRTGVFQELNQYNVEGALKYQILQGTVRPYVGGALAYVHRKYERIKYPQRSYGYGQYFNPAQVAEVKSSHAFDFGALAGVDIMMTEGFSLGVDLRYFMNFYNRIQAQRPVSIVNPPKGSLIEEQNRYSFTVSGQFLF